MWRAKRDLLRVNHEHLSWYYKFPITSRVMTIFHPCSSDRTRKRETTRQNEITSSILMTVRSFYFRLATRPAQRRCKSRHYIPVAENVLLQRGKNRTDSFKHWEIKRAKEWNSAFPRPQNGRVSVTSQTLDRRRHPYIIRRGLWCTARAPTMEVRTTATPWLTIFWDWNLKLSFPCFKTILHLYLVF